MRKTKEQVFRYVSFRDYTDVDWSEIASWIKAHYGSGLHRPRHPKINSDKAEFFDWIKKECLAEGDVIIGNGFMGAFHELPDRITDDAFEVLGWYDAEGVLHRQAKELHYRDANIIWQVVDEEMTKSYYQRLREDGYTFSVSLGTIIKRNLPAVNSIFKFSRNGKDGIGVIDSYMDKAAHMVVSLIDNIETDYWVPTAQLDILKLGKKETTAFFLSLEQQGMSWDASEHKLILHIKRAVTGGTYWFINDRFGISSDKETGTKVDGERYKNRNYFLDYQEALRFRELIYKLRGEG